MENKIVREIVGSKSSEFIIRRPDYKLEAEDFIESIENDKVKKLMYDLRKICGTFPMKNSERSDKDLIIDAFRLIRKGEDLI